MSFTEPEGAPAMSQVVVNPNSSDGFVNFADSDKVYFVMIGEGFVAVQSHSRKTGLPHSMTYYPASSVKDVQCVFDVPQEKAKKK